MSTFYRDAGTFEVMLKLKPVEASVVDDQAVFCVALSRFRAHPQLWAQSEEDHVRDCQEERDDCKEFC